MFLFSLSPALHAQGDLSIIIHPVFNGKPLLLNEGQYITGTGDTITIEEFRFYMSHPRMINQEYVYHEEKSYHLPDASDSLSLHFVINRIPSGHYSSFDFMIGVDSMASVSGAMDGALDPTLGMYWAWNTGYINAKLTGHSPVCKTLHHAFEFHIGGYLPPYQTIRKVSLPVDLNISSGKTSSLDIDADVAVWFRNIRLFALNNVVIPSKEAMKIADNYMEMFSVSKPNETK